MITSTTAEMKAPAQIPAPFLDTVQYTISSIFVLQIHLVLVFDRHLDETCLKKALRLVLDREPVFGSRFVVRFGKALWQRIERDRLDKTELLRTVSGEGIDGPPERRIFLAETIDETKGPQLKALLERGAGRDILVIKANHQVVDAGGTKELGYLVATLYRELNKNPDFSVTANRATRSLSQVFTGMSGFRLLKIFGQFFQENASLMIPLKSMVFPSGMEQSGNYAFSIMRLDQERVDRLIAYCRRQEATLNDLFVAALFRTMIEVVPWQTDSTLRLICTVDLRRYLPGKSAPALCNLSGFFVPNLGRDPGEDLDQTLSKVKAFVDRRKENNIGLSFILVDGLMGYFLPFGILRTMMRQIVEKITRSRNMAPALTNLGPIDADRLDFGGFQPAAAEVLVPPTCPPFFAIGLSGYKNSLTVSIGYYASAISPDDIRRLFNKLDSVLPG